MGRHDSFYCAGSIFEISYPHHLEDDARLIQRLCTSAAASLCTYFEAQDPRQLMALVRGKVVIHGGPSEQASEGHASTETVPDGRALIVRIHHLAPSRHTPTARTMLGDPMDELYHLKTIVHELAIVFLCQLTRRRWTGWQFLGEETPEWFKEGYEEYLALTRSSGEIWRERLPGALAASREVVESLNCVGELAPYRDGPMILAFLHDRGGAAVVQSILTIRETTFDAALAAATGFTVDDLFARWKAWMTSGPTL